MNNGNVERRYLVKAGVSLALWVAMALIAFGIAQGFPDLVKFQSGMTLFRFAGVIAAIVAGAHVLKLLTGWIFKRQKRPAVEAPMVGRLYDLLAALVIVMAFGYGFGKLGTFAAIYGAFGGMLLGWSLQAPVSGFAAWVLVSLKRPFRPGDRIQFPNLGLTGNVMGTGPMYTTLNQVGGTIGSEEAVGRYILVPNAMLFSQVVINYTVAQDSPYMLDEAVVRITYDSDWEEAEEDSHPGRAGRHQRHH